MDSLTKGKNLDTSKVTFSSPKVLDNGAKLVYVNYNSSKFNIQTPWMDVPWNMSCYSEGAYPKYSMEFSFRNMDNDPEIKAFHDKLYELQDKIVSGGLENSVSWFKKRTDSREVIQALYNPIVKVSKDKETGEPNNKYPPTFKAKVPQRDGRWECRMFKKGGDEINVNDGSKMEDVLVKNCKIRAILQCVGLWIASGSFMCQWKLVRAEVDVPAMASPNTFLPDSDDEDDAPVENTATSQMLDDSTDEEEEEEEENEPEPDPEPEPPKKKRIIKKKKKVVASASS